MFEAVSRAFSKKRWSDHRGSGKSFWRMEPMPKLDRAAYVAGMREQLEAMLGRVADAINEAKDGEIIAGSERPVFDLFAEFRRTAFEAGLQMRTARKICQTRSEAPA